MNFLEIVNEVIFDRFSESRRESIERYVNSRYGRIWSSEAWSFKRIGVPVTLASGETSISLDSLGLQRVESVHRSSGNVYYDIDAVRPEDLYGYVSSTGATPYEFSVYGNSLRFDAPAISDQSLFVLGEKKFVPLVAPTDVPLIPEEYHMMLVHGAASEALRMENDPTWQGFEQDYLAYFNDMRASYLTAVRAYGDSYPAWVPSRY